MKIRKRLRPNIISQANSGPTRARIAAKIGTGDTNVRLALKRNKPGGRCTKYDFIEALTEILNVDREEILEDAVIDENVKVKTNLDRTKSNSPH